MSEPHVNPTGMVDQYLYRLSGADDTLLYVGISNDWTRRIREHWRDKPWAHDIFNVSLQAYGSRSDVLAAERAAITAEVPLYNIQHNNGSQICADAAPRWTTEDVILVGILAVAAGYVIFKITEAAVSHYRNWKADHNEFREWQRVHRSAEKLELEPVTPSEDADISESSSATAAARYSSARLNPQVVSVSSAPPVSDTLVGVLGYAAFVFLGQRQVSDSGNA